MSQRTEQVENSSSFQASILDVLEKWYHVPVLAALLSFMFGLRIRAYDNFFVDGQVFFSGNDSWYHWREVMYTIQNWPATMPFDPWTNFPNGTTVGQFGTAFDQLIALVALIVGFGDPSESTVAAVFLLAPAVFGVLVAVPTYFIGKRLSGRPGALFGVFILAFLPGVFLRRGLVGFTDHHIAEVLFQVIAVFVMMIALTVAEREKPVFELVLDRDVEGLRRPLGWSILAGIATAFYIWTWPPGVMLIGIFAVFFFLKLLGDYVRGVSPDPIAFAGSVSMGTTGLLTLLPVHTVSTFSPNNFSLLQPLLSLLVAFGCLFMAWLAREWDSRSLAESMYAAAILGILAVGTLFTYFVLPRIFSTVQRNLVRFIGFGQGAQTRTIGEAQPFLDQASPQLGIAWYDIVMREYGLMLFTAVIAAAYMVWRVYAHDEHRAENLLVLVWTVFIISAAFTQVRFNYYLVVPVAVLNAYLFGQILRALNLNNLSFGDFDTVEGYQVLAIAAVFLLVVPVLVVPMTVGATQQQTPHVLSSSETGPGDVTQWGSTLDWMAENTPAPGTYGGADNEMELYGTFSERSFEYPDGAYGVMSWWDYGHWITVRGERIPHANPFQQNAESAAEYLLATNESAAEQHLNEQASNGNGVQYVMVDWKMANTDSRDQKFFAPITFNDDVSPSDFYEPVYNPQNGQFSYRLKTQNYYESQLVRLYQYHGSAVQPEPVVVDYEEQQFRTEDGGTQTFNTLPSGNGPSIQRLDSMQEARQYVEQNQTAQIGGVGAYPNEYVPALQHYRLVKQSEESAFNSRSFAVSQQQKAMLMDEEAASGMHRTDQSWVKVFERVPGATVEGTAPAGSTVTASVEMQIPNSDSTFTYEQRAEVGGNGEFTMVLPYSTTGYDEWGTDAGYTNVSVRANGPYEFRTNTEGGTYYTGEAHVTEGQVIGEDGSPVTVSVDNEQTENNQESIGPSDVEPSTDGGADGVVVAGAAAATIAVRRR